MKAIKYLLVSYANLAEKASLNSRLLLLETIVFSLIYILADTFSSHRPGTKTTFEAQLEANLSEILVNFQRRIEAEQVSSDSRKDE